MPCIGGDVVVHARHIIVVFERSRSSEPESDQVQTVADRKVIWSRKLLEYGDGRGVCSNTGRIDVFDVGWVQGGYTACGVLVLDDAIAHVQRRDRARRARFLRV